MNKNQLTEVEELKKRINEITKGEVVVRPIRQKPVLFIGTGVKQEGGVDYITSLFGPEVVIVKGEDTGAFILNWLRDNRVDNFRRYWFLEKSESVFTVLPNTFVALNGELESSEALRMRRFMESFEI